MTDEQFCKIESALTGEPIDKVEQLVSKTFTGRELKEYLEDAFALHSVSGCYWDKPKKIELKLEDMASGEIKRNIKGLK